MVSAYEVLMLICFGAAWPFSIYKSYKSKSTAGKSVIFLFIVLVGYVFGILHKLFYNMDMVIYMYALNGTMVMIDIALYFCNKRLS